jgi:hypothetical protein
VRFDRDQLRLHAAWALPALLLTSGLTSAYVVGSKQFGDWLGGGSPIGLLCGLCAALIIGFEMLLWPRKVWRRLRLVPAKHWMAAHIWFGLVCPPLAILHSGFHWGGWLPTVLLLLLILAVLSGIYGLVLQNVLPKWMLRNLPAETIYSQIEYVSQQSVDDARRLLTLACGPDLFTGEVQVTDEIERIISQQESESEAPALVVGASRESGRTTGRMLLTTAPSACREDAEVLWQAFGEITPFLLHGQVAGGPVAELPNLPRWFAHLRAICIDDSEEVISALERLCQHRHQFDLQQKVHRWLHGWIPIHLGVSVALSILLLAHIWTALRFW